MASFGYESAVRAVALDTTIDGDAAEAVGDVGGAVHLANEPGGVLRAGGDGAADGAVLDGERAPLATNEAAGVGGGGVDVDDDVKVTDGGMADLATARGRGFADVTERSHAVDILGRGEGQRLMITVEGAAEVVVARSCHTADADVGAQLHDLAAEAVPSVVVVEAVAEKVPSLGAADDVRAVLRAVAAAKHIVDVFGLCGGLKGLAGSGGFLCIGEGAFVVTTGFVLQVFALGYRHGTAVFRGLDPAGGGVDGRVAADGVRSTCRGQLAAVEINIPEPILKLSLVICVAFTVCGCPFSSM